MIKLHFTYLLKNLTNPSNVALVYHSSLYTSVFPRLFPSFKHVHPNVAVVEPANSLNFLGQYQCGYLIAFFPFFSSSSPSSPISSSVKYSRYHFSKSLK